MKAHFACIAVLLVATNGVAQTSKTSFPKPISSALPTYPEQARAARIASSVKLWFLVDDRGAIAQAGIVSGHPILADPALAVVKSWKFDPGSIQSNVRYETEFVYDLKVQTKPGEPKLTVSITDCRRVEVVSELYVAPIY